MGWVVKVTPWPFNPRERPGTHFIGVWVGPRESLVRCGKTRFILGFDPRTFQPVASRYTNRATQGHSLLKESKFSSCGLGWRNG